MDSIAWLLSEIAKPATMFLALSDRLSIVYLLSSVAIAYAVFVLTKHYHGKSAKEFLTRPGMFLHPSARLDYYYVWINRILFPFMYAPFLYASTALSETVLHQLSRISPPATPLNGTLHSTLGVLTFSLIVIVAYDFGVYLAHLASHRIPLLWEFHKVHHSAEVLTPITVYRMHPIDDLWTLLIANGVSGVTAGVIQWLIPGSGALFTVGEINIFLFLFYFLGFHLRHSPVWFSYGPHLSKVLISPAQHQIHHSTDPKHFDTNFGFLFALWDWIFGSLYVPRQREELEFGLPPQEGNHFTSVTGLYVRPFKGALTLIQKKLSGRDT